MKEAVTKGFLKLSFFNLEVAIGGVIYLKTVLENFAIFTGNQETPT